MYNYVIISYDGSYQYILNINNIKSNFSPVFYCLHNALFLLLKNGSFLRDFFAMTVKSRRPREWCKITYVQLNGHSKVGLSLRYSLKILTLKKGGEKDKMRERKGENFSKFLKVLFAVNLWRTASTVRTISCLHVNQKFCKQNLVYQKKRNPKPQNIK